MSKIAVIKQSADDWNYADIVITDEARFASGNFDLDECYASTDFESTAHTFNGTDSPDFDEAAWIADIKRALAGEGYDLAGEIARVSDFVQTVPVADHQEPESDIDKDAHYLLVTVPHMGQPHADVAPGAGWLWRFYHWLARRDSGSITFFDEDFDAVTVQTLRDWAADDCQMGAFVEVPWDAPATRDEAEAIIDGLDLPFQHWQTRERKVVERALARHWGDRHTYDFNALYDTDEEV